MTRVRGIRGATTATGNSREAILEATTELLTELVVVNELERDDVAAALFTTTDDLTAEFPALAARSMGWTNVALMCSHEMGVPGALARCVRVLLLVNTDKRPEDIAHVYLRQAVGLRSRGMDGA